MKILAIEFSSEQRSVAIVEKLPGVTPVVKGFSMEIGGRNSHAIGLVEEALRQAGMERGEIETIAVGIGPGSYTGIRAAVAFAQGWQLGREVNLVGISSVECLAAQVFSSGFRGRANFIVDAQRNEFYHAEYEVEEKGFVEVISLHLSTADEVKAKIPTGELIFGPDAAQFFEKATSLMPDARTLGMLACEKENAIPGEKMDPIYLREVSFIKAPPSRIIPVE